VLELTQEGSKVEGSMRMRGTFGQAGGPVEGHVTGDRFQFWQQQRSISGEATVDGDKMKGQLTYRGVGGFTLRRGAIRAGPPTGTMTEV
jgi:hypothetical protein